MQLLRGVRALTRHSGTGMTAGQHRVFTDPPIAKFLFGDVRMAVAWFALRLYMGWSFFDAGFNHKLQDPAWMQTGDALKGFWLNVTKLPAAPAKPPITFDWYRSFLQFLLDTGAYTWFGKLIAIGETAVGIALILGAFTGVAAAVGGFMSWNFMLAGVASTNPVLLLIAVLLVLAWKTAGYLGFDYVLLPLLGTPWHAPTESERQPDARGAPPGRVVRVVRPTLR
jgi:thiosulfate dehydrogenase [quinone] large subunit